MEDVREEDPNNPGYDRAGDPLVQGVVVAVGALVGEGHLGPTGLHDRIEAAMTQAVIDAGEKHGLSISNPDHQDAIRELMLEYRDRVTNPDQE